ncbi:TPA: hypothetical protein U2K46_002285 [Acinetobacter baumannii]|nr:hypothetical protein [Acinetobacter baumannii]
MKEIFLVISVLAAFSIDSENSLELNLILLVLSLGFAGYVVYLITHKRVKKSDEKERSNRV